MTIVYLRKISLNSKQIYYLLLTTVLFEPQMVGEPEENLLKQEKGDSRNRQENPAQKRNKDSIHEKENSMDEEIIPLDIIVDDLYVFKNSLISNSELTPNAFSCLNQIESMLTQFPELASKLYEWKFLEKEALYFLRTNRYIQSLRIATEIISNLKKAPQMYFSKKFLFFITEKLYFAMGGTSIYKKEPQPEILLASSMQQTRGMLIDGEDEPKISYDLVKPIMKFIKALISIDRSVSKVLYDTSFFILANACICVETAEMFNQIFVDIVFSDMIENKDEKTPWTQDGLYEIRRQFFEPEVIFRNRNIFCPKSNLYNLKSGVYKLIYDGCTNIRDFADLSLLSTIDLLLYNKILYMNDEIEPLILEAKNPKIIKYYRRYLEAGGIPEKGYLKALIKAIDNSETSRDATITLYYFREFIEESKSFTETRVRTIIQNLEYLCNYECKMNEGCVFNTKNISMNKQASEICSFNSNMCSNVIFGETMNEGLYNTPKETPKQPVPRSILEDFSEFDIDIIENQKTKQVDSTEDCERYRIIKLIEHIYTLTDKKYFFKPTYLILFRSILDHLPSESKFVSMFFTDFVDFIGINDMNISKVFMPVNKTAKRAKMREIQFDDDSDTIGFDDRSYFISENQANNTDTDVKINPDTKISTDNKINNGIKINSGIKVNKGMIESDDEDEIKE